MLEMTGGFTLVVIVRHLLIQDGKITGFFNVIGGGENQPQRVVIKVTANGIVTALGKRLVLVVRGAVFKLRGGDIQNTLFGTLRHLVYKADQVLVGISKAHAPADTGFKERGTAAHIESHHALVLVPDVYHPIQLLITTVEGVSGQ